MAIQMEKILHVFKQIMVIIVLLGALNYGSIGLFNRDLISEVFQDKTKYAYDIIGLSAIMYLVFKIILHRKEIGDSFKSMM